MICWKLTKDVALQSHRILHTFVWCVSVGVRGKFVPPPPPPPPPPHYINVSGLYSFTTLCGNIFARLTVSPWRKLGKFSNFKPLSQKYIVYGYSLTVFTKTWEKQKQKQNPKGRIYLVTFIFRTWSSVVVHNRFFFLYFASIYRAPSSFFIRY